MTTTDHPLTLTAAAAQITALWPFAHPVLPHDASPHLRIFTALAGIADRAARDIYHARRAAYRASLSAADRRIVEALDEARGNTRGT